MFEIMLLGFAFVVTLPIVATILLFYILKYVYKNPIKAFHKAINWTTILYILAVNMILSYLFHESYFGYIIVFMLCILTIIIIIQWKKYTEIDYYKAFKLLWRLSFLLFFMMYLILLGYGIIRSILF